VRTAFITRNIIQLVFETLKQHYPVKPLNEILDLSNGKSMTKASMSADGCIPVYGANGVIGLTHKALTLEQTITIGRVGSCGEVNLTSGQAWISDNAMWVSRIVEGIDRDYLYFALKSLPLAVSAKIAAMPSISQTNVFRESIPCPSIREQLQVAAFLKDFCQGKNVDNCAALPPFLLKLRRIVAQVEELAGKIEEARALRQQALRETELIIGASLQKFFSPKNDSIELGKVSTVIDPNPSHRYPLYVDDGVPIISTVDFVGEDGISTALAKRVPLSFYEDTLGRFGVGHGDIIFSRKGKVGYARLHPINAKLAMTHTLCVIQPDRNEVLPRYLLHFTRSPAFINYLMGTMNPNVGVPTLGLGVIRSAPFNLPPLAEQQRIVAYLDNLQVKVDEMKRLREEAIKELDAMLPSILDKAFKGEL